MIKKIKNWYKNHVHFNTDDSIVFVMVFSMSTICGVNHFVGMMFNKLSPFYVAYLCVCISKKWHSFELVHNRDDSYYDGYLNSFKFGFFNIFYGT